MCETCSSTHFPLRRLESGNRLDIVAAAEKLTPNLVDRAVVVFLLPLLSLLRQKTLVISV